jgi:hypothetical protein
MSPLESMIINLSPQLHIEALPQLSYELMDWESIRDSLKVLDANAQLVLSVFLLIGVFLFITTSVMITGYLIKSAAGIDLVAGWSSGLWQYLTL